MMHWIKRVKAIRVVAAVIPIRPAIATLTMTDGQTRPVSRSGPLASLEGRR